MEYSISADGGLEGASADESRTTVVTCDQYEPRLHTYSTTIDLH